jgi:hypothetical protein
VAMAWLLLCYASFGLAVRRHLNLDGEPYSSACCRVRACQHLANIYLSINSAYLAIRFDGLAVVPPLEGGYSLWLRTSYIWD